MLEVIGRTPFVEAPGNLPVGPLPAPQAGPPGAGDDVSLGPREPPSEGVDPLLQGLRQNFVTPAEGGGGVGGVGPAPDVLKGRAAPDLDPLNVSERVGGEGRSLVPRNTPDTAPVAASESVETPGQAAGGGSPQLVLPKEDPGQALAILQRERGQQEVAAGGAVSQGGRVQALETSLGGRSAQIEQERIDHERGMVSDSLDLQGRQDQLEADRAELAGLGRSQQEAETQAGRVADTIGQLQGAEEGERARLEGTRHLRQQHERDETATRGLGSRYGTRAMDRRADEIATHKKRTQSNEATLGRTLGQLGRRRAEATSSYSRAGKAAHQAVLLRERRGNQAHRVQTRLDQDRAGLGDRQVRGAETGDRLGRLERQQKAANQSRQANESNASTAQGNAEFLRQMEVDFGRRGVQDQLDPTSRSRASFQDPQTGNGTAPRGEDRGDHLLLHLKPLNGGTGGIDAVAGGAFTSTRSGSGSAGSVSGVDLKGPSGGGRGDGSLNGTSGTPGVPAAAPSSAGSSSGSSPSTVSTAGPVGPPRPAAAPKPPATPTTTPGTPYKPPCP